MMKKKAEGYSSDLPLHDNSLLLPPSTTARATVALTTSLHWLAKERAEGCCSSRPLCCNPHRVTYWTRPSPLQEKWNLQFLSLFGSTRGTSIQKSHQWVIVADQIS